jgi:2'-5' RNA ligase
MESLEVIARPHFEKADLAWLTDIRSRRAGSRGPPYFTLVFPGVQMEPRAFADQVRKNVGDFPRIRLRLRSALVVPEHAVGRFHVFLIPDEGFGAILRLHDRLHAGPIETAIRPETPYLPHITVATTATHHEARKVAQALNQGDLDISGHIETLTVERRAGEVIREIAEIPLARHGLFG